MKILLSLILFVTLSISCYPQTPATKEHVKTLLELTGSGKLGIQVMENMIGTLKKSLPDVPDEFWNEFMKDINAESLIELIIPIYVKYYSDEDVVQLTAFYQTPLGKKVTENLPLIAQESYAAGTEWGKKLGEKAVAKLKEGGYLENK